jgi:glycosyltransferase involved in cell wall biosynthesis
MEATPSRISLFFPVYRDEATVARVTQKALGVLRDLASEYEVIIVDDGSPDKAGAIADDLACRHTEVRVIHHERNLGYGQALRTGFTAARFDWICFTDGDDEYEVTTCAADRRLLRSHHHLRYAAFSWRVFVSYV